MKKIWARGDFFIWIAGATLAISLIMVSALMSVVLYNGLRFFWPKEIVQLNLKDGTAVLGQNWERERIPRADLGTNEEKRRYRVKIKRANRDIDGADFIWIDEDRIASTEVPGDAAVFERYEWGDFYGFVKHVKGRDQQAGQCFTAEARC